MVNNSKDEFIVALDIGTTKVLCLVADYDDDGNLRIVGVGQESCTGLNKGVISEIDATVSSIRKAKDQARAMTNCKFTSVTTGIAGNHIQSYNGNAAISILNDENALGISQLSSLIKDSNFIIANDTGPAHMAAHLGSKGLTLFGSHTTAYKVSIERENFKPIQVEDLNKLSPEKVLEYIIDKI